MKLRERAVKVVDHVRYDGIPENVLHMIRTDLVCYVEHNLREAVEEAVREDRLEARRCLKCGCEKPVAEATNYNDPCNTTPSIQPTAADALKAVAALADLANCIERPKVKLGELEVGIQDLLSGHRDTDEAKAIIGEGKINSNAKGE